MPSVFLVSDTHFGHAGVCRFTRNDGVTKLRPWTDPAEMDEVMKIAERYDLMVIEDCAQAPGAKYKGQNVGTIGSCGIFSFQKNH